MPKIVEIKKLGKDIKEIKPEKKEDLEEEIEENEVEKFSEFISGRRRNFSSTLAQSEIVQDSEVRQSRVSKEDQEEINFRPTYKGGGNPYKSNNYTPAGSAESSGNRESRSLGERPQEQNPFQNQNRQQEEQWRNSGSPEQSGERSYFSQQEQSINEKRRKSDF